MWNNTHFTLSTLPGTTQSFGTYLLLSSSPNNIFHIKHQWPKANHSKAYCSRSDGPSCLGNTCGCLGIRVQLGTGCSFLKAIGRSPDELLTQYPNWDNPPSFCISIWITRPSILMIRTFQRGFFSPAACPTRFCPFAERALLSVRLSNLKNRLWGEFQSPAAEITYFI